MENNMSTLFERIKSCALSNGAHKANVISVDNVELDRAFRDMCASNACGVYGRCWMCPPDVGDIETLMNEIKEYEHVLVYQTVYPLEDSYDFEGMQDAKKVHYKLSFAVREAVKKESGVKKALHLGCGGCGVCEVCAKRTGEPCRYPELAMPSLEAYGVNVSRLAASADMKYINGQNTVTYFGAVFFDLAEEV